MEVLIREARHDDVAQIGSWTRDTFPWGDYVAEELPGWIGDRSGTVLVADDGARVVAVGRITMVSGREAWAQGARVHPAYRRRGIGTELSTRLWAWARDHGAQVARLAVEDDNHAAAAQVASMGFRHICDWRFAVKNIGGHTPMPAGNGGRRVPAAERLHPAPSAEAEPAFHSWSAGDLAKAAHGLAPSGWVWHTMTPRHVAAAARRGTLWEGRPGWAIVERDDPGVRVHWLETAEQDARAMVHSLVDHAVGAGADRIEIMAPYVPWLDEPIAGHGFDVTGLGVHALAL